MGCGVGWLCGREGGDGGVGVAGGRMDMLERWAWMKGWGLHVDEYGWGWKRDFGDMVDDQSR